MVVGRGAPAAGRGRALDDRRQPQAVREQAADLAGGDQVAKAQGAVIVRLDDVEQHQEPDQGRIEAGLLGKLLEPERGRDRRRRRQEVEGAQQRVLAETGARRC